MHNPFGNLVLLCNGQDHGHGDCDFGGKCYMSSFARFVVVLGDTLFTACVAALAVTVAMPGTVSQLF